MVSELIRDVLLFEEASNTLFSAERAVLDPAGAYAAQRNYDAVVAELGIRLVQPRSVYRGCDA